MRPFLTKTILSLFLILMFNNGHSQIFELREKAYQKINDDWYRVSNGQIGDKIIPHRLVLRLSNRGEINAHLLESLGIKEVKMLTGRLFGDYFGIEILDREKSFEFAKQLAEDRAFEHVSFDAVGKYFDPPDDTWFNDQWNLDPTKLQMENAWQITTGNPSIILAVLETGFDYFHQDLVGNIWQNLGEDADGDGHTLEWTGSEWVFDPGDINHVDNDNNNHVDDLIGWDFYGTNGSNPDMDPYDDEQAGHGTSVAGIAMATTNNNEGVAGVAGGWASSPGISIMCLRNGKNNGTVSSLSTALSIQYACQNGADIINMSFGWVNTQSAIEAQLVEAYYNYNIIAVAAVGNDNLPSIAYPARSNYTVAVGATAENDLRWQGPKDGSNYGSELDVMAPGGFGIYTTAIRGTGSLGDYESDFGGTSAASPHVAGLAGLIFSIAPGLYNFSVKSVLLNAADEVGQGDPSGSGPFYYGSGRINAEAALQEVISFPTVTIQNDIYENHNGKIKFNNKEKESPFISKLDPNPPEPPFYYQIEALNSQNINSVDYYFQKWSDGSTSNPRHIIPQTDSEYSAIYKGHLASNTTSATALNNGRRILKDPRSEYPNRWYMVYEDHGEIYFSISDDDGDTWTTEKWVSDIGADYNSQPSISYIEIGTFEGEREITKIALLIKHQKFRPRHKKHI